MLVRRPHRRYFDGLSFASTTVTVPQFVAARFLLKATLNRVGPDRFVSALRKSRRPLLFYVNVCMHITTRPFCICTTRTLGRSQVASWGRTPLVHPHGPSRTASSTVRPEEENFLLETHIDRQPGALALAACQWSSAPASLRSACFELVQSSRAAGLTLIIMASFWYNAGGVHGVGKLLVVYRTCSWCRTENFEAAKGRPRTNLQKNSRTCFAE